MDRIGDKLKNAREARKLSLKDVAKETNITHKYIEALENEEFERFPGETYVTGFLRKYAEYLKLDADEMIQAYKGYQIGESATPLEELTKPTRSPILISISSIVNRYKSVFYVMGIASILVLVIWIFSSIFSSSISVDDDDSIKKIRDEYNVSRSTRIENIRNLQLSNDSGFILVYVNEVVQFLVDNQEVLFLLKEIKNDRVIVELLPGNIREFLEMEKPKNIRIKNSPREVVFTLKGLTENRAKIMIMLGKRLEIPKKVTSKDTADVKADSTKVTSHSEKSLKIVFEADIITKTYLELYLDGMKKIKGIIPGGTKKRWEATEYIQLKIGNAGGLKVKINGKDYNFGLPGQVANKIITWKKDLKNPNVYHIVVKDW